VVDTANLRRLNQVFDVQQVREEMTRADAGTFLLTEKGLRYQANEPLSILMPSIAVIETIDFISGSQAHSLGPKMFMDPRVSRFSAVFI
jgi:hypothetical protein